MKIKLECASVVDCKCDVLIVNEFEGVKHPGGATGAVDKALGGEISKLLFSGAINGKLGSTYPIQTYGKIKADEIICVGLGKSGDFDLDKVRIVSDAAIKAAKRCRAKRVATIIHGAGIGGLEVKQAASAVAEGSLLGDYKFKGFKTEVEDDEPGIEELVIVDYDPEKIKLIEPDVELAKILVESTNKAKDLVNSPSNKNTPTHLAEYASSMAKEMKMECQILGREEIIKKGMDALYSVSKGSKEEPKVIVLKYNNGGKSDVYGLIGKGVTFDSGGISIKPSSKLSEMKTDMAGAATVIEVMRVIAKLKLKINVIAVIPATENMPGGNAYKPGDIIGSLFGKTIEIISTDAEGRLILADAISYAKELGAKKLIDIATLTGGCRVALGDVAAGIMGNDDGLIEKLIESSKATGEKLWRLPLYEEYKEYLKSDVADIKNCTDTGGKASPSVGGIFLQKFAGDTGWAHIDIGGTAYLDKAAGYLTSGATGYGVRLLADFFKNL
ncbi:MAG: leucyl aminopeptidase [bacterium]